MQRDGAAQRVAQGLEEELGLCGLAQVLGAGEAGGLDAGEEGGDGGAAGEGRVGAEGSEEVVRQDGGGLEGGGAALAAGGEVLRRSEGGVVWFSMGRGRTLCAASPMVMMRPKCHFRKTWLCRGVSTARTRVL